LQLHDALLQWRDVLQDEHAPSVGGEDKVVRLLLHDNPGDGSSGQARLQLLPVRAIIERIVECVAGAGEEIPLLVRVLRDYLRIGQRSAFRQSVADLRPRLSEVGSLVEPWIAIVHHVEIYRDVGRTRIEIRRLDLRYRSPGRQATDVLGDVIPRLPGIAGIPDLAIVGAGPDQALLHVGGRDGKDHFAIELPKVIADDAA